MMDGSGDEGADGLTTTLGTTSTTFADRRSSLTSSRADSSAPVAVGDFALLSDVNDRLPPGWSARLADDGAIRYVNGATGRAQAHRPTPTDTPDSERRRPFFDTSGSSSPAPGAAATFDFSRRGSDPYDDTSDLEPDPTMRARASTSSATTGTTRDDNRRKLRELEESLASAELDGIPVLALKVRTAAKALKSALGQLAGGMDFEEGQFAEAEATVLAELDSVLAAARALVQASGVLGASPAAAATSESLKRSHAKVQRAVTGLIGAVELFRHAAANDEGPDAERRVVSAAEDVERTVVAFGLEAERGRNSAAASAGSSTIVDRRPRRLEAWLDSAGVALPLGGRGGFSSELDRDIITRPFGLDAEDDVLQELQQEALRQIDQYLERTGVPVIGGDPSPAAEMLCDAVQAVLAHLRSFDIAMAIDLDGEEPHPASSPAYVKLVASANEILRQFELALDAFTCSLGDLACALGSPELEGPVLAAIRRHLPSSVKAFMALNTVSLAQAHACHIGGVKGRLGARRPASSTAGGTNDRSTSRLSVNSARSRGSIGSRRSQLLSLRSGRRAARGLDEEVGDDKPTEEDEEIRDKFSYADFANSAPSVNGRTRQNSVSAMSTVSSSSSLPWESGYGTDSRLSGISSKSNIDALNALRGRRESADSCASTNISFAIVAVHADLSTASIKPPSVTTDVSRGMGKASKLLGVNSVNAVVLPPADIPWYLEGDVNEDEIVMADGRSEGAEREIKGGSIEALVTRLTQHRSEYSGASCL